MVERILFLTLVTDRAGLATTASFPAYRIRLPVFLGSLDTSETCQTGFSFLSRLLPRQKRARDTKYPDPKSTAWNVMLSS